VREGGILWFRNDLRLTDNEALCESVWQSNRIYPVYVFDERIFSGKSAFGLRKIDTPRAKFILDAVTDLRNRLRDRGSDLIIRIGKSEEEVYNIAKRLKTRNVFCNRERTYEEVLIQDALEEKLWSIGQELRYTRGKMLYYTADLPFPVTHSPDSFNAFRREVEKFTSLRPPLTIPDLPPFDNANIDKGELPALSRFEMSEVNLNADCFNGGESRGLEIVENLKNDASSVNVGQDSLYSGTQLSPWLSHGCLSPKTIYFELSGNKNFNNSSKEKHPLYYQLLWRDYHRLICKKYGNAIFCAEGIKPKDVSQSQYQADVCKSWVQGETDSSLVNAIMSELKNTGFINDLARRISASYLVHVLKQPWLYGASYYEQMLIDYDPCSNYGNWMEIAGVGAENKESKFILSSDFDSKYDRDESYRSRWLKNVRV